MASKTLTALVFCGILVSGTFAQFGSTGGGLSSLLPFLAMGNMGDGMNPLMMLMMLLNGQMGGSMGGMSSILPYLMMGGMGSDRMMRMAPLMLTMGGGMGGGSSGMGLGGGSGMGSLGGGMTGPM